MAEFERESMPAWQEPFRQGLKPSLVVHCQIGLLMLLSNVLFVDTFVRIRLREQSIPGN